MSWSVIMNVTIDCVDTDAVSGFWSAATRWPREKIDMPGNPFWMLGPEDGGLPRMVFVEVAEPKRGKNRVHLGLLPQSGSQADEIARLESLGARMVDDRRDAEPGGWVVMADPEGNEFCVEPAG